MIQYFSADYIFPVSEPPIKNGVVGTDKDGKITAVLTEKEAKENSVEFVKHKGAIVPGFINAHCHLELSHMRGIIPEGTGLVKFVKNILQFRNATDEEVIKAAAAADAEMFGNGIVAVGDISNRTITADVKRKSKLYYHTFLELLGFKDEAAERIYADALMLLKEYHGLKASIVPHAPYSVSAALFKLIALHATRNDDIVSIHNQETLAEQLFFESKTGDFLEFFDFLGIDVSAYEPFGANSLRFHLPLMAKAQKTLLVHNTFTNEADLDFAETQHKHLYWCLCPNANLYIERNLPDAALLEKWGVKVTIGTDSLASNHHLNILDEIKVLQEHKNIEFNTLLKWATWNGAEFLGLTDYLGSIAVGKQPGLNLIDLDENYAIKNNKAIKLI